MTGLESAIDGFFLELRDFTKSVEDEVGSLKRNLEQGYSLGPHQFRDRLKDVQRQCREIENGLVDLEYRSADVTPLTEMSNHCMTVYQSIIQGTNVLEAHLRNYGYRQETSDKAPFDPLQLFREMDSTQHHCPTPLPSNQVVDGTVQFGTPAVSMGCRPSVIAGTTAKSHGPLTTYAYTAIETQQEHGTAAGNRGSFQSFSTFSQDAFQCSPGTLALKKKYMTTDDPQTSPKNEDARASFHADSFEFRPHPALEATNNNGDMDVDEQEGEGETGFAEPCPETPSTLPRTSNGVGVALVSPRLSFTQDQARFGSPFRSPHKKPEKSTFTSPPSKEAPSWIPIDLYNTLPQYLKSAVPHSHLNNAFPKLSLSFPTSDSVLSPSDLERTDSVGDKFILQAFVKLQILERHFKNGSMCFQLGPKWNALHDGH